MIEDPAGSISEQDLFALVGRLAVANDVLRNGALACVEENVWLRSALVRTLDRLVELQPEAEEEEWIIAARAKLNGGGD
jgi:hypothetical protein